MMDAAKTDRQQWMAILANARPAELEQACADLPSRPDYHLARRPETGLAMVRGRIGGSGQRFNLGEMTVTRCALRTADGRIGVAYIAGRQPRHAELAALMDAMLQDPEQHDVVEASVIAPLAEAQQARRAAASAKAAATKVEFFTMVRGD